MSLELFKLAFSRYGNPVTIPNEESIETFALKMLLELLRKALKGQKKSIGPEGPIYCDLLDNPTFNALATTRERHEFITLFMGAVDYIYRICFYLLSDPKILEGIGDSSQESLSADALASIQSGAFRTGPLWLPKNQTRVMAARDLALLTCYFILLHEAGHIIHPDRI